MTKTRLAIIGAAALNVPTTVSATVLPTGAVALSAAVLAATGAALGAMLGWGITNRADEVAATPRSEPAAYERMAA
jgi:membrane protein YqaA with SNARE-associated domain